MGKLEDLMVRFRTLCIVGDKLNDDLLKLNDNLCICQCYFASFEVVNL